MNSQTIGSGWPVLQLPREVAALVAALNLREPDTMLLGTLSDSEWASLLAFTDLAHLTLRLSSLPEESLPAWVVERIQTNVADNSLRFERVKAAYREAGDALDRASVPHIVIKGFTQSPDYVPDPHLRSQSDLDLYCPPGTIESAQQALQSIGYTPEKQFDPRRGDHAPAMIRLGNWQWRGNPFDPEMPLSIELHYCLWNQDASLFTVTGTDSFWDRRTTRIIDGLSFPCLHPVDHLGYLTLHILRNIFTSEWVVNLVRELAVFLHSHADDDMFWQSRSELHDPSLRQMEAIAFYYARAWFDCQLHPQAEHDIANLPPLQQSWLHRFAGSAFNTMFHQNKDAFGLHLSFLESPHKKLILLKRLFVPTRISPIKSPAIKTKNRRALGSGQKNRYLQYIRYLASRGTAYTVVSLAAILRAIHWRISRHQFASQFWIFLAASFFLTWACQSTFFSSTCS